MRYIFTLLWSFLLVTMLNYVVGSIANVPFDFLPGVVMSVVLTVLVAIIGESLPEGPVSDH